MKKFTRLITLLAAVFLTVSNHAFAEEDTAKHPNIVVILADDMGYDSTSYNNPEHIGKMKTPHLDRLATEGMNFIDAHSNSAVCTPTRYGVLTGRYAWRTRLKQTVLWEWGRPLIKPDRLTLPELLKNKGYHTAMVGKWHLGLDWHDRDGGIANRDVPDKGHGNSRNPKVRERINNVAKAIDYSRPISGGPLDHGFDHWFGVNVPNFPPYAWIEDRKVTEIPSATKPERMYGLPGAMVPGWSLEDLLPTQSRKSTEYIAERAKGEEPFFLFVPLTSPHTPIAPSAEWKGRSGISPYADFVMQTDAVVGEIVRAIDEAGIADNTLVIFTTDNGTSKAAGFNQLRKKGTNLQYHWRGMKADGFEGGHRVPFIARWPGQIEPGSQSDEIISTVDFMATFAEIVGVELPDTAAEDSVSLLPVLKGEKLEEPLHEAIICHSAHGVFVVRKGKWKLQYSAGSGGWSGPSDQIALRRGLPKWQLYDLSSDPKETNNLIKAHPEVVVELTKILRTFVEQGRSTPGEPQENHNGEIWWKGLPWEWDRNLKEGLEEGEFTRQKDETNQVVSVDAEWMVGPWFTGRAKYSGFEGKGYVAPLSRENKEPLSARIKLPADSVYKVEVRSLVGGAHSNRGLVVEVNGKKLKPTHTGDGPSEGKYVTESAGTLTLPGGATDVKVYATEGSLPVVDFIMFTPVSG